MAMARPWVIKGIQIPGLDGLPVRVTGAARYDHQMPASPPGKTGGWRWYERVPVSTD